MNEQISMDELMKPKEKEITEIPIHSGHVIQIPDDVWETRCKVCIHKNSERNIPCDLTEIWRSCYEKILPCRIIGIAKCCDIPGECKSFAPRLDASGFCRTCAHTSHFHDGYCMKADHAPEHQVCIGNDYGQEYYRHSLFVCDDYEPDQNVKEGRF